VKTEGCLIDRFHAKYLCTGIKDERYWVFKGNRTVQVLYLLIWEGGRFYNLLTDQAHISNLQRKQQTVANELCNMLIFKIELNRTLFHTSVYSGELTRKVAYGG
jgi:hypothetical protein